MNTVDVHTIINSPIEDTCACKWNGVYSTALIGDFNCSRSNRFSVLSNKGEGKHKLFGDLEKGGKPPYELLSWAIPEELVNVQVGQISNKPCIMSFLLSPYLDLIENATSHTPHCQGEIFNQPDPTSAETDSIPYGKCQKVIKCLIANKDAYLLQKIGYKKERDFLLSVCLCCC